MHGFKLIIFSVLLLFNLSFASDFSLLEGTYVDQISQDSIYLEKAGNEYKLESTNGNIILFHLDKNNLRSNNPFGRDLLLKISNENSFKLIDSSTNSSIANFKLSSEPGWFLRLIQILASGALLISIFQAYLKVNKIWKRRTITEVANSISIVASLLGFAVLLPFLLNSLIISQDYLSAGKSLIGLFLALLFSLISSGYFLEENRGKSLTRLLINALSAEKSESTDLISSMVRPKGAKKIIDILHKLAAIDDDVAKEEIDLINDFAQKWRIEIPELKPGKPDEVTNLVELKALVQSYLDEGPDIGVAEGLVDLINVMAEADDEVTPEEAMAVSEFTGMISHYVSLEKGGEVEMFEVNIVPQGEEQIKAVQEILPDLNVVDDRGGKVFKVGKYFSEDYAEAVCKKYIALGLYSGSSKIKVDLSEQ